MTHTAILVDGNLDKVHSVVVKRLLSLLLVLGALMGLLAQEVAFASAPAMQSTVATASQMSDECAEMMGVDASQPDEPCQGLTLDCLAKMGCAVPSAIVTPAAPLAVADHRRELVDPLAVQRLVGRSVGPEPDPPLIFG